MCLRATGLRAMKRPSSDRLQNGAHAALQRDLGEDVVAQVAQHSAGVGLATLKDCRGALQQPLRIAGVHSSNP